MKKMMMSLIALVLIMGAVCIAQAEKREIILMTEYRVVGNSERFELGALDNEGRMWTCVKDIDEDVPYGREALLDWAETTDELTEAGSIGKGKLNDILSLVETVPAQEVEYKPVADDAGSQTSTAVRRDGNGGREIIVLGASGDEVFENTDPSAQALYRSLRELFPQVTAFDGDANMAPAGFEQTPLLTFMGYDGIDLTGMTVSACYNDCEAGEREIEPEMSADDVATLRVTGMRNAMFVTGDTVIYRFTDADGDVCAIFEFYGDLLVTQEGMYSLVK